MEETQTEWKGYIIVKAGKYWKVRHVNVYVGGSFTTPDKSKAFIDAQVIDNARNEYNKEIKKIRKIKDLKQRTKEYKKLCQTPQSS